MLLQFNFWNFGPFRDEVSLSLEATPYAEYKEQIRLVGNKKILPLAAIFGANASGKSFVYRAFSYRKFRANYSLNRDLEKGKAPFVSYPDAVPFRLDSATENAPSSFEVVLTDRVDKKEVTLQYGFSVYQHRIAKEWLYQLPNRETSQVKEYLNREGDKIEVRLPKVNDAVKKTIEASTPASALVLSLAGRLNVEPFQTVFEFFASSLTTDFGNLSERIFREHLLPNGFVQDKAVQQDCISFLQSFEPSIKGLRIEEIKQGEGQKQYKVNTIHQIKDGKRIEFRREDESAGTRKMFAFYSFIRQAVQSGSFLFVDELNARLHPLLLRNLLLLFLSRKKNPNNAQIAFTCHEPWILNAKILRRDEIYFTNKKRENEASELYSLAEFRDENGVKIRSDEDFEKNYLLGKYDGIPVLTDREVK